MSTQRKGAPRRAFGLRWLAFLVASTGAGQLVAAPAPGHYDGELCVTIRAAAPSCGRAQLDWARNGLASARVDDIVYRLQVRAGRKVAVLLTQGAGQLDEFVAEGGWDRDRLRFADADRNVRYELKFGKRQTVR